jgi:hypothetical protein
MLLSLDRDFEFEAARPGEWRGVAGRLADMGTNFSVPEGLGADGVAAVTSTFLQANMAISNNLSAWMDLPQLAGAAYRQATYVDNMNGRDQAMRLAADQRIEDVERVTGIRLDNPMRRGYFGEAMQRASQQSLRGEGGPAMSVQERALSIFHEKLAEAAEKAGDRRSELSEPLIETARRIAQEADTNLNDLMERAPLNVGLTGAIAGAVPAMFNDQFQVLTMPIGPSTAAGRTVTARILDSFWKNAGVSAGVTAAMQPDVQGWRADAGLENGLAQAATNTAIAAAFGGLLGGVFRGVGEAFAPVARGGRVDPELASSGRAAARSIEDDNAVLRGGPVADRGAAAEILDAHVDAALDEAAPLPDLVLAVPAARADQADVIFGRSSPGDFTVNDKPVLRTTVSAQRLATDAETFQYKADGDGEGVGQVLRQVRRWDPLAAGELVVYERADGTRVVADGHQRSGLARRLSAEGQDVPDVPAIVFREVDGWTPEEVRALAAKRNIQQGSGTVLDAAKLFRADPTMVDDALPIGRAQTRDALGLARLSQPAFDLVVNQIVREADAALVGRQIANQDLHVTLIQTMARERLSSEAERGSFLRDLMESGFVSEQTADLFGDMTSQTSLFADRARVLSEALTVLARDRQLFSTLVQRGEQIRRAGNAVNDALNAEIATDAAAARMARERLASSRGPVSDLLSEQARLLASGEIKKSEASRAFVDGVRALISERGFAGLEAEPRIRLENPVEPATPQALEAAEALAPPARDTQTLDMFSEATPAGEQGLIPGIAPVSTADLIAVEAARPMRGGDAPAGGLFDEAARTQRDLIDMIPAASREDGKDARLVQRVDTMADADRELFAADLTKGCKT